MGTFTPCVPGGKHISFSTILYSSKIAKDKLKSMIDYIRQTLAYIACQLGTIHTTIFHAVKCTSEREFGECCLSAFVERYILSILRNLILCFHGFTY